jgi:hypothetical protein
VEWNHKAGQNPPRVVAPTEGEEEECICNKSLCDGLNIYIYCIYVVILRDGKYKINKRIVIYRNTRISPLKGLRT